MFAVQVRLGDEREEGSLTPETRGDARGASVASVIGRRRFSVKEKATTASIVSRNDRFYKRVFVSTVSGKRIIREPCVLKS